MKTIKHVFVIAICFSMALGCKNEPKTESESNAELTKPEREVVITKNT